MRSHSQSCARCARCMDEAMRLTLSCCSIKARRLTTIMIAHDGDSHQRGLTVPSLGASPPQPRGLMDPLPRYPMAADAGHAAPLWTEVHPPYMQIRDSSSNISDADSCGVWPLAAEAPPSSPAPATSLSTMLRSPPTRAPPNPPMPPTGRSLMPRPDCLLNSLICACMSLRTAAYLHHTQHT